VAANPLQNFNAGANARLLTLPPSRLFEKDITHRFNMAPAAGAKKQKKKWSKGKGKQASDMLADGVEG